MQTLSAQELGWSGAQKFRNKNSHTHIIGENKHGVFVLRSKSRNPEFGKVYIERYREDLSLAYSKHISALKTEGMVHARATVSGFEMVTYVTGYDGEENLILHKYNEIAQEIEEAKLLHSLPSRTNSRPGKFLTANAFEMRRILFVNIIRGAEIAINLLITDGKYEPLEEKTVSLAMNDYGFKLYDIAVDERGNVFMICSYYETKTYRRWEDKARWQLLVIQSKSSEIKRFDLNKDDAFLSKVKLNHHRDNNVITVAGFYGFKNPSGSKGTLDFQYDVNQMKVIRHEFVTYAYNMVSAIIGKKAADRGDEALDLELRRIVSRSDGGYLLIGEEYYITEQSYTFFINGIAQVNTRNVYNYGKIVLISVGPKGEPEWERIIPKSQKSQQDAGYFTSLVIIPRVERVELFFNDGNDVSSENRITRYSITNTGLVKKEGMLTMQTSVVALITRECKQMDSESVLFSTSKDRKFALLRYLL